MQIYLLLAALFAAYLIKSRALYIMTEDLETTKPAYAFIPLLQDYAAGRLAEKSTSNGMFDKFVTGDTLPVARIIWVIITYITLRFGGLLAVFFIPIALILFKLYYVYAMYMIYSHRGRGQFIYRVLSFIFGTFAEAAILFSIRKADTNYLQLPEALLTPDKIQFDEEMSTMYDGHHMGGHSLPLRGAPDFCARDARAPGIEQSPPPSGLPKEKKDVDIQMMIKYGGYKPQELPDLRKGGIKL